MAANFIIGIDIGTQGTKTIVFDEHGNIAGSSFEASNLICPEPGVVYQKAEEIFSSVINTVKEAVEKSGIDTSKICAIGMDSQMAGIMGIDKDFNAATYYDSWLDTQCEKYIEVIKKRAGKRSVELNGAPITYTHGPKILWWKNEHPEIYSRIAKFVLPHVYAAGRLCGIKAQDAVMDYTCIHFSGFADNLHKQWSDELLSMFEVNKEKLPDIDEPWRIIGRLKKEYADACGIPEGIAVVAGCGDSAAACLGAGIVRPGQVFDVAGTASIFSCCVDKYKPDIKHEALMQMRSVIDGFWMPLAYINGGGLCLKWFKDEISGADQPLDYKTLEEEADKLPPGSEGLIFIPHFAGRVCPNDPYIRGCFIGLNLVHRRGHLFRAVMEGIAYEYKYYLKVLKDIGIDTQIDKVFVMGGGAKSVLFNKIKADVLGVPYVVLRNVDTAALGSAIVAGYGIGLYNDIAQTAEAFKNEGIKISCEKTNHDKYEVFSDVYSESFPALRDIFKKLGGHKIEQSI